MYRVNVFKLDLPLTLTQMNLLNDIYQIKEWMQKGCYLYPYSIAFRTFSLSPQNIAKMEVWMHKGYISFLIQQYLE